MGSSFVRYCCILLKGLWIIYTLSNKIGQNRLNSTEQGRRVTTPSQLPAADADRWLSVDDIAAYLGVKRDTIYKWINRRRMPAHKVGRLWKFRKYEVDHWVCSENARGTSTEDHANNGMVG